MMVRFSHFCELNGKKILFTIISINLILGAFYSYILGDHFRYYDEEEYFRMANNIINFGVFSKEGIVPTSWKPPGYPFFLSTLIFFGGNIILLRFVNYILLSISLYLVYKILEKRSNLAAVIGIFLIMCSPIFFYTASTLYPQTFITTLFLIIIYLITNDQEIRYLTAVKNGVIYGGLILTVATFIGSALTTCFWILFEKKHALKKAGIILISSLIVIAPWTLRNYLIHGSFVFISTNSGLMFAVGNSENTKINYGVKIGIPYHMEIDKLNEVERDRYLKSKTITYIMENKLKTLKMYILKLLNYFNYSNILATEGKMTIFRNIILFISYYFLLILSLLRFMHSYKNPLSSTEKLMVLLYISHGLFLALFVPRIRYRIPYDPILAILGASYLANVIKSKTLLSNCR